MRKAILIGTMPGREGWFSDCLASLSPVVVDHPEIDVEGIATHEFELRVIEFGAKHWDEFIFVPDSTVFLKPGELVEECFGRCLDRSVSLSQFPGPFGMYLGKYKSSVVNQVGCPIVHNKLDAVRFETEWTRKYAEVEPFEELGNLPHSDVFEDRHGRLNMVCENQWVRRYKASWDGSTMRREHERIEALK